MTAGIIDTTVLVHYFRQRQDTIDWIDGQDRKLAVTAITWMEFIEGARHKKAQQDSETLLKQFNVLYLNAEDQKWAMQQLKTYQLSHAIGMNDCLIASVVKRFQVPLYSHNIKDMKLLLPDNLVVKPY